MAKFLLTIQWTPALRLNAEEFFIQMINDTRNSVYQQRINKGSVSIKIYLRE